MYHVLVESLFVINKFSEFDKFVQKNAKKESVTAMLNELGWH